MKLLKIALLALLVPTLTFAEAIVGSPAPEFELMDIHGTKHSLSQYKDKTVVLEWFNHECPYVKKHYSSNNMQELQKKHTDNDIVWLTINSSAPSKQGHLDQASGKEIATSSEMQASALLLDGTDGKVGRLYGAKTTPHMFVINPQGVIAYAGAIDSNSSHSADTIKGATNYIDAAILALSAGKPVETASTTPYGCSVKYDS